jgi:hypothetical protein
VTSAGVAALDALERAKLRTAWLRLLRPLQSSAYKQGLRRAGYGFSDPVETVLDCELTASGSLGPVGPIAPTLRVTLHGREVARVRPREGFWSEHVAEQVADALDDDVLERLAAARGWVPVGDGAPAADGPRFDVLDADEFVFVPLRRSGFDHRSPAEALLALEADRVAICFGGGVEDDHPLQPIYLHDERTPPLIRALEAPAYVVARRSALAELGGIPAEEARSGDPAPALWLIERALRAGWLVARRDVHGIREGQAVGAREFGRAAALARSQPADRAPVGTVARAAATLLWEAYKARGRPSRVTVRENLGAIDAALPWRRQSTL